MDVLIIFVLMIIAVFLAFTSPAQVEVTIMASRDPIRQAARRFAEQGFVSEDCVHTLTFS